MPYINHDAIHEAGHVIIALCCDLDVKEVLIKPAGKYTARCELIPTQAIPRAVYAMKLGGSVAVDIQNEKEAKTDDNGFGNVDDSESDAYCIACLDLYWNALGMTDDQILECGTKLRAFVKSALSRCWPLVEALAQEIATLTPSGPPVSAVRIGDILQTVEPAFYEKVKPHLLTG
jgi:hypothetical protein